jgi:hypothetical protein
MLPYTACAKEVDVLKPHARQSTKNPTQIDRLTITSSLEKSRKSQPYDSPNACSAQAFVYYLQTSGKQWNSIPKKKLRAAIQPAPPRLLDLFSFAIANG